MGTEDPKLGDQKPVKEQKPSLESYIQTDTLQVVASACYRCDINNADFNSTIVMPLISQVIPRTPSHHVSLSSPSSPLNHRAISSRCNLFLIVFKQIQWDLPSARKAFLFRHQNGMLSVHVSVIGHAVYQDGDTSTSAPIHGDRNALQRHSPGERDEPAGLPNR